MIKRRRLILSYTIQEVIPNICTKFQNPKFSSSWEIFDEKKSLHSHSQSHTHTHTITEKTKLYTPYIPIYFLCRGYNDSSVWQAIRQNQLTMKYRSLTYIYLTRTIFVSYWSIIPNTMFLHQIVFQIRSKISGP